jgi:hypothetical protein
VAIGYVRREQLRPLFNAWGHQVMQRVTSHM